MLRLTSGLLVFHFQLQSAMKEAKNNPTVISRTELPLIQTGGNINIKPQGNKDSFINYFSKIRVSYTPKLTI